MKGIVFNLLHEAVAEEYGEDAWDAVLAHAGVTGAYTSLGSYDDAELEALVGAAVAQTGHDARAIVRWFGRVSMPHLAARYPAFFEAHTHTRPFLLTLNTIIHPEVRKLYPGADVPDFDFDTSDPEVLRMTYRSARRMCAFAEGLIEGAAAHYGEAVAIAQSACMHEGAAACVLEVRLGEAAR